MKTMIFATAAVLCIGIGSAFAGDGEGPAANTRFTQIPGVVARARVPQPVPTAVARNQNGAPTAAYVTQHSGYISLFASNGNQGNGS
jgi:hypothetical protein